MSNWRNIRRRAPHIVRRRSFANTPSLLKSRLIVRFSKYGFLSVILLFIALFFIFPLFAFNLPTPDKVVRREGFSTKILDRNGKVLYDIFQDERRTPINLEDTPLYLRQATIAIEDKNFYKHQGFDPLGMIRGISRVFTRGYAQGGSTLTQQLVKNVLLTPERSVFRKIKEFILSVQIERKYTKDEILQMYLNEAPYGGTAWGVEAAAEIYFGKSVKDLNLTESAILAGMPQRPSYYSPYSSNPKAYVDRTQDVLRRMREDGYITKEQEEEVVGMLADVQFQERGGSFKAPHFVQYVQGLLEERYGERAVELGGLKVTTTLDLDLQDKAQEIVREEIEKVESLHITNGAGVVLDPQTGEILAMVGSKNFNDPNYDGQVNVTTALRQPGSAIKPITYVTAFKKGFTPSTLIMDVPTEFPGGEGQPVYKPVNYDGKYRGPIQVRYALANSINVAAVKMLALTGIKSTLETAYDLGINSLEPTKETLSRVGLSLTLGGGEVRLLELTGAYSTFTNEGFRISPSAILKVEDSNGKILENNEPKKEKRVISEDLAYLISDILSDNSARTAVFGPNSLLNIPGIKVAVKTGTTNDKRDNWTIGGTASVMVGVWVGNNDNSEMKQVASGVSGASPIWRRILLEAVKTKPKKELIRPSGIVTASVDSVSGYRSHDGFPARDEIFAKGMEPGEDIVHVMMKVCKSDGKIATPGDVSSGNYDQKEYFVFKEDDPTAGSGGENRWQKGINEWLASQGDSRYHPPSEFCGTTNPVSVEITEPSDRASNLPNNFTLKARADSSNNIVLVEFRVGEEKIRGFTARPYEETLNLANGVYILKAKARDDKGNEKEINIQVGVGVAWDYKSPTPSPTPSPTSTPIPTP